MPAPPSSAERCRQGFEVVYVDETEGEVRMPLAEAGAVPFERVPAVREFPNYRGQRNYPGLYYAATVDPEPVNLLEAVELG